MNKKAFAITDPALKSDEELQIEVLAGNLDAFEGIMRHHNQRLFRVARSIVTDDSEAMDVVQESYISAFRNLGKLQDPALLPNWLAKITRNTALMRLRKSQRIQHMDEPEMDNVLQLFRPSEQPDRQLANAQLRQLLEDCIDDLPGIFRTVFMLRAVEQCSVQTTAEILDIPQATVKTRFHRARLLMQKRLLDFSTESGVAVHEFAGHRCNTIVHNVLNRLRELKKR